MAKIPYEENSIDELREKDIDEKGILRELREFREMSMYVNYVH